MSSFPRPTQTVLYSQIPELEEIDNNIGDFTYIIYEGFKDMYSNLIENSSIQELVLNKPQAVFNYIRYLELKLLLPPYDIAEKIPYIEQKIRLLESAVSNLASTSTTQQVTEPEQPTSN